LFGDSTSVTLTTGGRFTAHRGHLTLSEKTDRHEDVRQDMARRQPNLGAGQTDAALDAFGLDPK
jgi:hypothetical protein